MMSQRGFHITENSHCMIVYCSINLLIFLMLFNKHMWHTNKELYITVQGLFLSISEKEKR